MLSLVIHPYVIFIHVKLVHLKLLRGYAHKKIEILYV